MSKNPILFRTPATAVDGESVEPSYVQFELSHEGLKSWQEQCEIFKTREWLQSMRSMSLPAGLDWDGLGPINSYSQLSFLRSPNSAETILIELTTSHDDEQIVSMAVPLSALVHLHNESLTHGWTEVAYDPDGYADFDCWAQNDYSIQVINSGDWVSDHDGTSEAREVIGKDAFGQFYGAMEVSMRGGGSDDLYWSEPMPNLEAAKEVASQRVSDWLTGPTQSERAHARPRA